MKLKRFSNFINEKHSPYTTIEYKTEFKSILYMDHEDGLYYGDDGVNVVFGDTDLEQGELVPELKPYFKSLIEIEGTDLDTLKYFPSEYVHSLEIHSNKLTDLIYCPKEIGGSLTCDHNQITSLKGAPNKIEEDFSCSYNLLTDLEHFPKTVDGEIFLMHMPSLKTLKGIEVLDDCGYLSLEGCVNLTSIDYFPKDVTNLDISGTGIKSLRSLADKNVMGIESDYIQEFEIDFYFNDFKNDLPESYDQQMIDYLIYLHKEGDIDSDDLTDHLKSVHIDFTNITYPDKYKNIFNSIKTISKFSL